MSESRVVEEICVEDVVLRMVHHAPGASLDDHTHEGATLGVLLRGSVIERRGDGAVQTQRSGDVFVRRPGIRHANQYAVEGARSLFVELDGDDPRTAAIARADALVRDELREVAFELRRGFARVGFIQLRACVRALLAEASSLHLPATPAWLEAAREHLAERFAAPPQIRELARQLGVHPVHFTQAFSRHFRLTPRAFVRAHRVFHAMALARQGLPLAQAAAVSGFADQSHMTRSVHATWGMPPRQLLREAWSLRVAGRRQARPHSKRPV